MQGYIMENTCSVQLFGLSYTSLLTLDTSYVHNSCMYKMIKSEIHQHKFYLLKKHSKFQKFGILMEIEVEMFTILWGNQFEQFWI